FDGCDGINAVWYLIEGDYANAATSAVAAFPLIGSLIGSGIKWGAKGVANAEKIADGIKAGSRIIGNAGALIQSGGQTLESVGNLYDSYVKDGEIISWKNATDLITLGLSVAGMGMAGKSLAKDGKALKAISKGNVNVKPAAESNSTASSNTMDNRLVNNTFFNNGERKATTSQIRKYKKKMKDKGINVIVDKKRKKLKDDTKAAGFDYSDGSIYIRKGTGLIDLYHEGYHAEQYLNIGQENYVNLGKLLREEYVYSRIMENSNLFNEAELQGARNYIMRVRTEARRCKKY
ncbi:MAG: hypothetical protein HDT30_06440, partial [Clostridiales bacterium]|nr:hypothetical protein [Clostridiales bacterium]